MAELGNNAHISAESLFESCITDWMKPTNDTNTDVCDYLLAAALDAYETAARTSERESHVTPVAAGQTPATTAMAAPHAANEPHLPKPSSSSSASSGYRRNRTPSFPCLSSRFAPPVTQSAIITVREKLAFQKQQIYYVKILYDL